MIFFGDRFLMIIVFIFIKVLGLVKGFFLSLFLRMYGVIKIFLRSRSIKSGMDIFKGILILNLGRIIKIKIVIVILFVERRRSFKIFFSVIFFFLVIVSMGLVLECFIIFLVFFLWSGSLGRSGR